MMPRGDDLPALFSGTLKPDAAANVDSTAFRLPIGWAEMGSSFDTQFKRRKTAA